MSKELAPLEALKKVKFYAGDTWLNNIEWDIIETALKDYDELEQKYNELLYNYQELVHCGLKSEQKKLKALEIIKKDENIVIAIMTNCKGGEDYDLLREVLL